MGVFHVFKIVQMVPNRAKHHIYNCCNKQKLQPKTLGLIGFSLTIILMSKKMSSSDIQKNSQRVSRKTGKVSRKCSPTVEVCNLQL